MAEYAASGLPPAYIVDPKPHGESVQGAAAETGTAAIQENETTIHSDRQDS